MRDVEYRGASPGVQMRVDDAQVAVLDRQQEAAEVDDFSAILRVEIVQGRHLGLFGGPRRAKTLPVLVETDRQSSGQHYSGSKKRGIYRA